MAPRPRGKLRLGFAAMPESTLQTIVKAGVKARWANVPEGHRGDATRKGFTPKVRAKRGRILKRRMAKLPAEQRKQMAGKALKARWKKTGKEEREAQMSAMSAKRMTSMTSEQRQEVAIKALAKRWGTTVEEMKQRIAAKAAAKEAKAKGVPGKPAGEKGGKIPPKTGPKAAGLAAIEKELKELRGPAAKLEASFNNIRAQARARLEKHGRHLTSKGLASLEAMGRNLTEMKRRILELEAQKQALEGKKSG